jgi:hypothetical protein
MRLILLILFLCGIETLFAMGYNHHVCPVSMAMGNASSCILSPYRGNNVASLALDTLPNIHTFYQNKATIAVLGLYDVALVYPFKHLNMAFKGNFHGFEAYREFSVQCHFAKFFKPYIAIALQVGYQGLYQSPKEGYWHTSSVDIGFMAFPTKQLRLGFSVLNVSFSVFPASLAKTALPTLFSVGMGYVFARKIVLTAEVQKAIDQPFAYAIGLDYQVIKALAIRVGLSVCEELTPSLGMGLQWGSFRCDVGFQYHFGTGLNSSIGLVYTWND